ncbi:MAG: alpha/beta hydrolase [Planctomycetota bacterium]
MMLGANRMLGTDRMLSTNRMLSAKPWWIVLALVVSCAPALLDQISVAAAEPVRVSLWSGAAPLGNGQTEKADAWLTVHRAEGEKRTAIVICPGGGYGGLVTGAEGHGIARWLNQHGITGAVLEYRLPAGRSEVPLLDAQRALRTLRARAAEWQIDERRVGIMGFSAGGHLASTAATHWDDGDRQAEQAVDRPSSRPDFAFLIYPVITLDGPHAHQGSRQNLLGKMPGAELVRRFCNDQQVTAKTPPTFLAHALDDKPVPPENSRLFYAALQTHKVPAQYLELPSGGHGLNGYQGPMWDAWQKQSLEWLKTLMPPH